MEQTDLEQNQDKETNERQERGNEMSSLMSANTTAPSAGNVVGGVGVGVAVGSNAAQQQQQQQQAVYSNVNVGCIYREMHTLAGNAPMAAQATGGGGGPESGERSFTNLHNGGFTTTTAGNSGSVVASVAAPAPTILSNKQVASGQPQQQHQMFVSPGVGVDGSIQALVQQPQMPPPAPTGASVTSGTASTSGSSSRNRKKSRSQNKQRNAAANNINNNNNGVPKSHTCPECGYATDRRDLFKRHSNIHKAEKPFACFVCDRQFNRADHVKKHHQRMHRAIEYDVNKARRSTMSGVSSVSGRHGGGRSNALIESSSIILENVHIESHRRVTSSSTSIDESINNVVINTDMPLTHLKQEKLEDGSMATTAASLAAHLDAGSSEHLNGSSSANNSGSSGTGSGSSNAANRSNRPKTHKCSQCDWMGSDAWAMQRHFRTHTKPYRCTYCDYKAARQERLYSHLKRVHQKYACKKCKFAGDNDAQLEQHMLTMHPHDNSSRHARNNNNNNSNSNNHNHAGNNNNNNNASNVLRTISNTLIGSNEMNTFQHGSNAFGIGGGTTAGGGGGSSAVTIYAAAAAANDGSGGIIGDAGMAGVGVGGGPLQEIIVNPSSMVGWRMTANGSLIPPPDLLTGNLPNAAVQKRGSERLYQYLEADESNPEDYAREVVKMEAIDRNTASVAQDFRKAGGVQSLDEDKQQLFEELKRQYQPLLSNNLQAMQQLTATPATAEGYHKLFTALMNWQTISNNNENINSADVGDNYSSNSNHSDDMRMRNNNNNSNEREQQSTTSSAMWQQQQPAATTSRYARAHSVYDDHYTSSASSQSLLSPAALGAPYAASSPLGSPIVEPNVDDRDVPRSRDALRSIRELMVMEDNKYNKNLKRAQESLAVLRRLENLYKRGEVLVAAEEAKQAQRAKLAEAELKQAAVLHSLCQQFVTSSPAKKLSTTNNSNNSYNEQLAYYATIRRSQSNNNNNNNNDYENNKENHESIALENFISERINRMYKQYADTHNNNSNSNGMKRPVALALDELTEAAFKRCEQLDIAERLRLSGVSVIPHRASSSSITSNNSNKPAEPASESSSNELEPLEFVQAVFGEAPRIKLEPLDNSGEEQYLPQQQLNAHSYQQQPKRRRTTMV